MSSLKKHTTTTVVPGNPGVPASAGTPGTPARCTSQTVTTWEKTVQFVRKTVVRTVNRGYQWLTPPPAMPGLESWIALESTPVATTQVITTCYPAIAPTPASPGVPPTAAQISVSLNTGWNSWARSEFPLGDGEFYQFVVAAGVSGVFLGVSQSGADGKMPHTFTHGLMIDLSGVWVYESGVLVKRLRLKHLGSSVLRVVKQPDKKIVYQITTDSETVVHTSSVLPVIAPVYAYCMLYSAGDSVNNAELADGSIQFGSA